MAPVNKPTKDSMTIIIIVTYCTVAYMYNRPIIKPNPKPDPNLKIRTLPHA